MAKTKPCKICGAPKRPGHPLYCQDHWILKQPLQVQVVDAQQARSTLQDRIDKAGIEFKRPPRETWPLGRAWCHGCYRFRRPEAFGKNATQCKVCTSSKTHASMVARTYGEEVNYDALFERQKGLCAICQSRQLMRRLAVHHDHVTGEVVALCCSRCNHDLLGAAHDSAQILLRAYALQVGGWPAVEAILNLEKTGAPQWNPAEHDAPLRTSPSRTSTPPTPDTSETGMPLLSREQRRLAAYLSVPLDASGLRMLPPSSCE